MEEPNNPFVDSNPLIEEPSKISETSKSEKPNEISKSEKSPENSSISSEPEKSKEHSNPSESTKIEERKNNLKKLLFGWVEDNYDKAFIAILILAFILRIWVFTKTLNQPLWYDAAHYLATAKNWGLGLNIHDLWYYRRGFFWPLFCALFFKMGFGETAIRFTEVLFSTGIVAVSYFLIKEMFNKKSALGVSFCMAISWIILFFTGRPLTNVPATFFVLLSLLFFWKGYVNKKGNKYLYLFAVFFALALLTRMQFLMFTPALFIFILIKERFKIFKNKSLWITLLIFILVMSPYVVIHNQHYGNLVKDLGAHYLGINQFAQENQTIDKRDLSRLHEYFFNLPYILAAKSSSTGADFFNTFIFSLAPSLIFIFFLIGAIHFFSDLIFGFDKILKNNSLQKKLFIFLWIVICFLFLGYIIDQVEQRYIMATLPFLFLFFMESIFLIKKILIKQFSLKKAISILMVSILILLLLLPNLFWSFNLIDFKKTSYLEVKEAGLWLKENSNPKDVILSASEPQIQYYSERSTYTIGGTEDEFFGKIQDYNPRFLMVSIFEHHEPWVQEYIENNSALTPIKAFYQNQQPVVIIYEFNNNSMTN